MPWIRSPRAHLAPRISSYKGRTILNAHERYWEDYFPDSADEIQRWDEWFGGDGSEYYRTYPRKLIARMGHTSVLDAGAGFCAEYFGFTADHPSISYSALDITPAFVKKGRERGIHIDQGSVEQMPFAANSFDCVYIRDTFRHLSGFESAMGEGIRVARHELMIVFCRPLVRGPENEIVFFEDRGMYNNRYSKDRISRYLQTHAAVSRFYFEPIQGKNGPDDLLRIFKHVGARRKWHLRAYTRQKD
ncbi:MAG: class I SAM-dependent methyltransferase [Chloroflexi bacterium]|nr:class I SAM-dependent methyltransferase [Chloroflexota bacterium]